MTNSAKCKSSPPMPRGTIEHFVEKNTQLLLSFLVGPLDQRLFDGSPRAAETLLHVEQAPQLLHQRIHELLPAIMRDEHGPGLRTTNAPEDSAPQVGVPHTGHAFEQGRPCGDTHT